jgi:Right handed beta helix region
MTFRTFPAVALAAAMTVAAGAQTRPEMRQPVLLAGKPFPRVERYVAKMPEPRRTVSVEPGSDLQQVLCALEPGDRLRVAKGTYPGGLLIDGRCRDGKPDRPIQVFFDREAVITPSGKAPALTIRRSHWHIAGPLLRLGDSGRDGIAVESSSVSLDAARISGGAGAGLRIARGASNVTISNCILSGRTASAGVEIENGASGVLLTNNRFRLHRAGSIRIGAAPAGVQPPRDIRLTGNTVRDDGATAILVARAAGLYITDNTLFAAPGVAETRGIEVREVETAVIRANQLSDFAVAVSLGRVDPVVHAPRDVVVDRNHLETRAAGGTGLAVEAGQKLRFANNVVNGFADAILLLGRRPALDEVTVANNLILGVSRTAFAIRDAAAAALFDFNVFSPQGSAVEVEVNGAPGALAPFLERQMPNSRLARVVMFDHDLARLGGIDTVDRGVAVAGLPFEGKAPDLGVAEQ